MDESLAGSPILIKPVGRAMGALMHETMPKKSDIIRSIERTKFQG